MDFSDYNCVEMLIGLGIVIIMFLYIYITEWKYGYWKRRGVPHLQASSFIFGNVKHFFFPKNDGKNFYQEIYNSFKDQPFVGYYEFQNPVLMIKDIDLVRKVLSQNYNNFRDQRFSVSPSLDPIFAVNPFNRTYHNGWKEYRGIMSPGMTLGRLRSNPQIFSRPYNDLTKFIDRNQRDLLIMEVTKRVTCDVVASFGWGVEGNACSETESPIYEMFNQELIENFDSNFVHLNKFLARLLGLRLFSKRQTEFFYDFTQKCIAGSSGNKTGSSCLLQMILQSLSKRENFNPENESSIMEITGHMCTFFLDGFGSAATLMSFIVYELMLHSDVQSKLRQELEGLDDNFTLENVEKLEYLNMVISETLRWRTMIHYLGRVCTESCTLGSVELKPGAEVIIPISAIHMDPQYFPDPERFNPENFSEENKKKRSPFAFLPFGNGPRMCLGMNYANSYFKIMTCQLVKDYEILPPEDHKHEPINWNKSRCFLLFTEQELYVRFKKLH